jgi:hypothetical protein
MNMQARRASGNIPESNHQLAYGFPPFPNRFMLSLAGVLAKIPRHYGSGYILLAGVAPGL